MDRNKVVEKFISARNSDFRVCDVMELVDALIECAYEEVDRRFYVAIKEHGLLNEVRKGEQE